jgi:uncharacterized protein YcaQ
MPFTNTDRRPPMQLSAVRGSTRSLMRLFTSMRHCRVSVWQTLVRRLRFAVPQWQWRVEGGTSAGETTARTFACQWRGLVLAVARESKDYALQDTVRLLTPFDPWCGTATALRCSGAGSTVSKPMFPPPNAARYYALTTALRDRVIGWGNLRVENGQLKSEFGYVAHQPRDRVFKRELDAELERIKRFCQLPRAEAAARSRQNSTAARRARR